MPLLTEGGRRLRCRPNDSPIPIKRELPVMPPLASVLPRAELDDLSARATTRTLRRARLLGLGSFRGWDRRRRRDPGSRRVKYAGQDARQSDRHVKALLADRPSALAVLEAIIGPQDLDVRGTATRADVSIPDWY